MLKPFLPQPTHRCCTPCECSSDIKIGFVTASRPARRRSAPICATHLNSRSIIWAAKWQQKRHDDL